MRTLILLASAWLTCAACAPLAPQPDTPESEVQRFVRQGYRPSTYQGQLVYCREESVTGSQFTTRECLTREQILERAAQTRATLESRAMHPNFACHDEFCRR